MKNASKNAKKLILFNSLSYIPNDISYTGSQIRKLQNILVY